MSQMTPRTRASRSTQARVVTSPATTATPVLTSVSQATRAFGSRARMASSTASEIWSATLSGCPSETDSEVNKKSPDIRKIIRHRRQCAVSRRSALNAQPPRARQCHPGPQHGCRAARQLRPPGHADGHGGHRRGAVARLPEAQPRQPAWADRDRFVLSNGHGSMLLYSVLHLTGYPLGIDELRNFRQLGCAHRGPSGARNRDRHRDHDRPARPGARQRGRHGARGEEARRGLQPARARDRRPPHLGVPRRRLPHGGHFARGLRARRAPGASASSSASTTTTASRSTARSHGWFTDDTPKRFEAYGWQVIRAVDGHDPEAIARAIRRAKREKGKPTLICCKTVIGYGAPNKQGKEECHGAALGADEVALARKALGWPHEPFVIPDEIRAGWDARARGQARGEPLASPVQGLRGRAPRTRRRVPPPHGRGACRRLRGAGSRDGAAAAQAAAQPVATRQSSQAVLNALGPKLPELLGGSADLTGSNNTRIKGARAVHRRDDRPATTCITACASSAWARS